MNRTIEIKLSILWREALANELDTNPYQSSGDDVRRGLRIHVEKSPKLDLGISSGLPRIELQHLFENPKTYIALLAFHGTLEVVSELLEENYLVSWINDEEMPALNVTELFGRDQGPSNGE